MKLTKLGSDRMVNVNVTKYAIDWERKVSAPQKRVKDFLRPFWEGQAVYEELLIPGSKKRVDLLNWTRGVIVEVSPASTHTIYNAFLHKSHAGLFNRIEADRQKREWAEKNDLAFIVLVDKHIKNLSKEMFAELGLVL